MRSASRSDSETCGHPTRDRIRSVPGRSPPWSRIDQISWKRYPAAVSRFILFIDTHPPSEESSLSRGQASCHPLSQAVLVEKLPRSPPTNPLPVSDYMRSAAAPFFSVRRRPHRRYPIPCRVNGSPRQAHPDPPPPSRGYGT